jgi:hypothetical protein
MKVSDIVRLVGAASLACTLGMTSHQVSAAVVLSGCAGGSFGAACGLDELIAGGSIEIDNAQFSGFTLDNFGGRVLDTSAIRVDPLAAFLNPGLTFVDTASVLSVADGEFTLNNLGFNVTMLTGDLKLAGNSIAIAVGGIAPGSSANNVAVTEIVLDQAMADTLSNIFVICDGASPGICPNGTSAAGAFSPIGGVFVMGQVDVFSDVGGAAALTSFSLQFAQVPEPGTLACLGVGLVALSSRRRRPAH